MVMEYPIRRVQDIHPFWFPCPECEEEVMHVVGMQPTGLVLKFVFMKNPVASTNKLYFIVCQLCGFLNARLDASDFHKLQSSILPRSIHTKYPRIAGFYSLEMLASIQERFKDDPEQLEYYRRAIKAYRLEL